METKIIPKRIRNKVLKILQELDDRMRMEQSMSFSDIHFGICTIMELQKDYVRKPVNRAVNMSKLLEWAKEHNVDCSCVNITQYDDYGFGLEATKDIKKGQKFLEIPLELIFSHKSFFTTDFGKMIKTLNLMPGVSLALALLMEMYKEDSFWKPYVDTLPGEYNMLLYFTPEEMELLCDTTLKSQALKFYQIALSQYLQIYKMMEFETDKKKLWPMKNFCFDDFRWAICTALTRQNTIENANGAKEFVLIPLWDMCNHTWGEVSTSFIYSSETIISEAMKDFKTGEQILIHYGDRSLSEMFLYGGYIIPNAPAPQLAVKIQLSTKDPAYAMKFEALACLGLYTPYPLNLGTVLKPKCLAFVRIFCMTKELLVRFLDNPGDLNLLEEQSLWVSIKHEIEVWKFLMGRCTLTERSYRNTLEQDLHSLYNCSSGNLQEIYKLRVEEKKLLRRFYTFCQLQVNFLQDCVKDLDATAETTCSQTTASHGPYPFICVGPHCLNGSGMYRCYHIDFTRRVDHEVTDAVNTCCYNKPSKEADDKNACNDVVKDFGDKLKLESEKAKEIEELCQ